MIRWWEIYEIQYSTTIQLNEISDILFKKF